MVGSHPQRSDAVRSRSDRKSRLARCGLPPTRAFFTSRRPGSRSGLPPACRLLNLTTYPTLLARLLLNRYVILQTVTIAAQDHNVDLHRQVIVGQNGPNNAEHGYPRAEPQFPPLVWSRHAGVHRL